MSKCVCCKSTVGKLLVWRGERGIVLDECAICGCPFDGKRTVYFSEK